jgi:hypothetical protein
MTLPTSPISLSQVNVELSLSATALISLNDTAVRSLAGVSSGQISMSNLQGKTQPFAFTISANQTNANLRSLAVAAGWNQTIPVIATIGTGVVISGSVVENSTAALTIDGAWAGGVTLINNGTIAGMGGTGRAGGNASGAATGGGRAVLVSSAVSINNTSGIIAGGGGGGGRGAVANGSYIWENPSTGNTGTSTLSAGGGGGGGGRGGNVPSVGGVKGSNSSSSANGGGSGYVSNPTAGSAGTISAAGSGGSGGSADAGSWYLSGDETVTGGDGSDGGNWGAAGSGGGAAGQCLSGNSLVTWIATGTRYGALV